MPDLTLRDQLTAAMEGAEEIGEPAAEAASAATPVETQADLAAGSSHARDQQGRFAPKEAAPQVPESATTGAATSAAQTPAVAAPRKAPKAWKAEYHGDFEKLDPRLQAYIEQRELESVTGFQSYRQQVEAEHATGRSLQEALAPFQAEFQANGIDAAQWLQQMGTAHKTLLYGQPQERLALLQQVVSDSRVPVRLAIQNANGQWQLMDAPQRREAPQQPPADVRTLVREELQLGSFVTQAEKMAANAAEFPDFEKVRPAMADLLRHGMADDYQDAYTKAIRMDPALWEAAEQRRTEAARQAETARVAKAKSAAVSPRSATPSGAMASGKKDRRGVLEDAFNEHAAGQI